MRVVAMGMHTVGYWCTPPARHASTSARQARPAIGRPAHLVTQPVATVSVRESYSARAAMIRGVLAAVHSGSAFTGTSSSRPRSVSA